MQAATLRSWDALLQSYRLYSHCDDGAIAEGYSESVARILVDHWRTVPRFAQLARKDHAFKHFVLSHIDATLTADDVETIKRNARTQCPGGLRTICTEIADQANSTTTTTSLP